MLGLLLERHLQGHPQLEASFIDVKNMYLLHWDSNPGVWNTGPVLLNTKL